MKSSLFVTMTEQPAFDGQPAQLVELTNAAGGSIVLMDIGATWLSCQLPLACGEQREVLLGVGAMSDFQAQQSYLGVTVGRYANRIAKGCFELEGETIKSQPIRLVTAYMVVQSEWIKCAGKLSSKVKVRWCSAISLRMASRAFLAT